MNPTKERGDSVMVGSKEVGKDKSEQGKTAVENSRTLRSYPDGGWYP